MKDLQAHFLPYQVRWLKDRSPIKLWDKTRQAGMTYTEAYEDCYDCATKSVPAVYYTSASEEVGEEYIDYCKFWTKTLNIAAQYLGETLIDSESDLTALTIQFSDGQTVNALSSNPARLRGRSGKIVLDEYAHRKNQKEVWAAAEPVTTWGWPLRIISTHNGMSCQWYKFIEAIKKGQLNWSYHQTDIFLAVKEGLLDKILRRETTLAERLEWIEGKRRNCLDEAMWLQEYCCTAVDESTALLTYELISSCEVDDILKDLSHCKGDLYLGMDIGRRKHLSVIWVLERLGIVNYTRKILVLEKAPFRVQRDALYKICELPNFRRGCIDATGLGMQIAEEAQTKFGTYRVEPVTFTPAVKEELAFGLLRHFEERGTLIPPDRVVREDLHSVQKIVTASGNIRLNATINEEDQQSHADRFWALALADHACSQYKGPVTVRSRRRRESSTILRGYDS